MYNSKIEPLKITDGADGAEQTDRSIPTSDLLPVDDPDPFRPGEVHWPFDWNKLPDDMNPNGTPGGKKDPNKKSFYDPDLHHHHHDNNMKSYPTWSYMESNIYKALQ